jgi:hypothetical protein
LPRIPEEGSSALFAALGCTAVREAEGGRLLDRSTDRATLRRGDDDDDDDDDDDNDDDDNDDEDDDDNDNDDDDGGGGGGGGGGVSTWTPRKSGEAGSGG